MDQGIAGLVGAALGGLVGVVGKGIVQGDGRTGFLAHGEHSKQQTAQPAHWDPAERAALDEVLLPRLEAVRSLGRRWSPSQGMSAIGELS